MKISIVEDCSPYYVKFTHDRLHDVIDLGRKIIKNDSFKYVVGTDTFKHQGLTLDDASSVIDLTPAKLIKDFKNPIVSIFTSEPGLYYGAHKDGSNIRFAINYIIEVHDEECKTSWYNDNIETDYLVDFQEGWSRELKDFNPDNHTPLKSTVFKENDCILFNTDIYHAFDNRVSNHSRHVLTIRSVQSEDLYFKDVLGRLSANEIFKG